VSFNWIAIESGKDASERPSARAHEEILLLEPELLALRRGVVGIQDAREVLGLHLVPHRGGIVPGVEGVDAEGRDGSSRPEAQRIDGRTAVAGSQLIEADRVDVVGADPAVLRALGVLERLDAAAELDRVARIAGRQLPHVPEAQPAARHLALAALLADHLREDSVIVADAVADGRELQRGQGIQETRRKAPETPVAEARVILLRGDVVEIVAHVAQNRPRLLQEAAFQAGKSVHERPSRQVFDREVAHPLDVRPGHAPLGRQPAQRQLLVHRQRQGVIDIASARRIRALGERPGQSIEQGRLEGSGL
jgi:hypothetical protein